MSLASKDHKDQITILSSFAKLRVVLSTMATFCATITDYDNRNVHSVGEDVYKTRSRNVVGIYYCSFISASKLTSLRFIYDKFLT